MASDFPSRPGLLRNLDQPWDILIIGGGATGFGAAVEAASRSLRTLLIERSDFAKGTSSRSTKLVHGGVRYLEQMNIPLVLDALRERGRMLANAPHLAHKFSFVVPTYSLLSLPYYAAGLKVYEMLSGKFSLGASKILSRQRTKELLPGVMAEGLTGGVLYRDGQFDDARYIVTLLRTLQDLGGTALNYVEAAAILQTAGKTTGIRARDTETGEEFDLQARAVINATGVFTEQVLAMDGGGPPRSLLAVSQGSHVVLPRSFLPGDAALMIPRTSDGRVLFAIPWHHAIVVGTTDEPVAAPSVEPRAMPNERTFLIDYVTRYLGRRPLASEVLSMWSGLRPLIRAGGGKTSKLSRDHSVLVSPSGIVTVAGGKWTTYRKMGEDAINRACEVHNLRCSPSRTAGLRLHGWAIPDPESSAEWSQVYGTDLTGVQTVAASDPQLARKLHPRLPFLAGEVVWAARWEMARTVEDVLARRTRALFLDARAAIEAAPLVADLLARELSRTPAWRDRDLQHFNEVAAGYIYADS
jgi:glycerol-3-phosphate dehydrogenase